MSLVRTLRMRIHSKTGILIKGTKTQNTNTKNKLLKNEKLRRVKIKFIAEKIYDSRTGGYGYKGTQKKRN